VAIPWVSAFETDFNYDYHVSSPKTQLAKGKVLTTLARLPVPAGTTGTEMPGLSSFYEETQATSFRPIRAMRGWRGTDWDTHDS